MNIFRFHTSRTSVITSAITIAKMVQDVSKAVSFGPTEAVAGVALRILETMKDVDDNDKECIKLMKKVVDFILIIQEEFDDCRAILVVSPNLSSQMDKFKDILYAIYEDPRICEKKGYGKRFINSAGTKAILADYSADLDSAISRVSFSLLLGIATGMNRLHTQNLHNHRTPPDEERRTIQKPLCDRVFLIRANITTLRVDAIVNAANTTLLGASSPSVDNAIHSAAGAGLYHECKRLNGCAMGDAKITSGHNLPAPYVIHTAGPVYRARSAHKAANLLASCYRRSLHLAADYRLHHIAFPAISTGANGYPYEDAARIALGETRKFLSSPEGQQIDLVIFTTFKERELSVYKRLIPEFFPASV